MKGNNELRLCKSTMIQVIQEWIDKAFSEGNRQTVTDITYTQNSSYSEEFTVKLGDTDRPGPQEGAR